ncbi:EamA family transporter [Streptomyces griseus]|uniref:EamA family transporter n=1 Tax=Streptomyces griseus TaxID=1911 RepID=UPI00055F2D51|nr:EamA family transporter [Streptomyces griseus]
MGALLALTSAVVYGIVDFTGGILSRRTHFATVTFLGQVGGLVLASLAALVVPAEAVGSGDLLWGALSGVGSGAAMHFLNRGLSHGAMSVVVPVSAVTSVALSVLCGVAHGDRPGGLAWIGIALTVPALWLVSGGGAGEGGGTRDGLLASLGGAVQYLALAQAGPAAGLWPLAAGRAAAVLVLLPTAARHARRTSVVCGTQAVAVGAGAALGLTLYQLATYQQMLAVAVVLASLYPALPVILGLVLLHERVSLRQVLGLSGAAVATVLLTVG